MYFWPEQDWNRNHTDIAVVGSESDSILNRQDRIRTNELTVMRYAWHQWRSQNIYIYIFGGTLMSMAHSMHLSPN